MKVSLECKTWVRIYIALTLPAALYIAKVHIWRSIIGIVDIDFVGLITPEDTIANYRIAIVAAADASTVVFGYVTCYRTIDNMGLAGVAANDRTSYLSGYILSDSAVSNRWFTITGENNPTAPRSGSVATNSAVFDVAAKIITIDSTTIVFAY